MDNYAVIGNPIQHSWSPRIHLLFAQQTQQQLNYQAILAPLESFSEVLLEFQQQGGKGLNVTLPFKQQAYEWLENLSKRATLAKAVNTIRFDSDGTCWGDNTDGVGFVRDVVGRHQFSLEKKKILILGAGGAVRGILGEILARSPELVVIANRTLSAAEVLAEEFACSDVLQVKNLIQLEIESYQFDLVINGTSMGLTGDELQLPPSILTNDAYCYDLVYGRGVTTFMQWAKENHAGQVTDGLGMLIEQAAESFYLWRGIRPETKPVFQFLSKA